MKDSICSLLLEFHASRFVSLHVKAVLNHLKKSRNALEGKLNYFRNISPQKVQCVQQKRRYWESNILLAVLPSFSNDLHCEGYGRAGCAHNTPLTESHRGAQLKFNFGCSSRCHYFRFWRQRRAKRGCSQ